MTLIKKEFITKKSYFRNDKNYGRTTQLISKKTGDLIFEGMGICSKKSLIETYEYKMNR